MIRGLCGGQRVFVIERGFQDFVDLLYPLREGGTVPQTPLSCPLCLLGLKPLVRRGPKVDKEGFVHSRFTFYSLELEYGAVEMLFCPGDDIGVQH